MWMRCVPRKPLRFSGLIPNSRLRPTVRSFAPNNGIWQPLTGTQYQSTLSYLHERDHKRELRHESAEEGTRIAASQHEDFKRNLEFNLRSAFVATLEAKAVLQLAQDDLAYYDKIIDISRSRYKAGDIAHIDLDRIELMRVQYESELQSAMVNLRTAKIQLLELLNDHTPIGQFDVTGPFDFSDTLKPLEDFRQIALDTRPDLQAALQAAQQAVTNHKLAIANGSTDPTFSGWYTFNPSFNNPNDLQTLGLSVTVPLRIFDRTGLSELDCLRRSLTLTVAGLPSGTVTEGMSRRPRPPTPAFLSAY